MTGRTIDQLFATHNTDDFGKPGHKPASLDNARARGVPVPEGGALPHEHVWGDARHVADAAQPDFRLFNLETTVTTSTDWADKQFNFRMHPDNVGCLQAMRPDCLALANNHMLDFGVSGLTETVATLDRAGIGHCGAGATILEASRPHRHELPDGQSIAVFSWALQDCGVRWAFWGATSDRPGINLAAAADSENAKYMAQAIRDQSRPEDLVIVTLHRGGNWVEAVPAAHRGLARYLIDKAGADVIHGHSAHHLLPFETYRGKPILYGCGDLINDYAPHPLDPRVRSDLTALFLVDIDRATHRLSRLHVQPLVRTAYRLKVPEREDRGWVRARILGEREPSS